MEALPQGHGKVILMSQQGQIKVKSLKTKARCLQAEILFFTVFFQPLKLSPIFTIISRYLRLNKLQPNTMFQALERIHRFIGNFHITFKICHRMTYMYESIGLCQITCRSQYVFSKALPACCYLTIITLTHIVFLQ